MQLRGRVIEVEALYGMALTENEELTAANEHLR